MPLTFEDLEKTLTFKQAWEIARKAEEPDFPWVHQRVLTEILKTQCYLLAIGEMIMSQQQTDVDYRSTDHLPVHSVFRRDFSDHG